MGRAAIVTVGSELVEGLRIDTNTAEIARALATRSLAVSEAVSVGDDETLLAETLRRLVASNDLVVVTGGLGPTHDDVTREAAAAALDRELIVDAELLARVEPLVARHREPDAADQVLTQAELVRGAVALPPTTGTAAGQIIDVEGHLIALLPGPPSEMRGMLPAVLDHFPQTTAQPTELGVVGLAESDAQIAAQRALAAHAGIGLTVLAKPGDVKVILLDQGAGEDGIQRAAHAVAAELGAACYSTDGVSLAETLVRDATARGLTFATAESCTGGLVSAAVTDVAGSSACFVGGVVSYSDAVKSAMLGVAADVLAKYGAVSEPTVRAMAEGARHALGADIAVAITGIAGPGGGTADKPVGLVWFAVAHRDGTDAVQRLFKGGSRDSVRARAAATALDLLRLEVGRTKSD